MTEAEITLFKMIVGTILVFGIGGWLLSKFFGNKLS